MNKLALSLSVIALLAIGVLMGKWIYNKPNTVAVTPLEGKITIIPTGDFKNDRELYNVILPDTVYMSMYAEEIAASLNEGEWHYNETLVLLEEDY